MEAKPAARYARVKDKSFETIEIDMVGASWLDGDMCAALGALLYRLGSRFNNVVLSNVPISVEKILSKNGFLSNYGRVGIPDTWGTTIPYQRFDVKDDRFFASYIEQEFVQRPEMPTMSKKHGGILGLSQASVQSANGKFTQAFGPPRGFKWRT